MKKILIVEDDKDISIELKALLENSGYEASILTDFKNASDEILRNEPDLVLLDINIPYMNGEMLLRDLRQKTDVPVIMVTSRDSEADEVLSMSYGADDYITKPFRVRELISRIKSVLRRYKGDSNHSQFKLGDLRVNISEARVWKQGEEVLLTALEYRLLLAFLNHPGQVLTRGQLLENIWDVAGDFVNDNTLTVYIKRLRDKLEQDPQDPQIIKTVRGVGYKLEKEGQL